MSYLQEVIYKVGNLSCVAAIISSIVFAVNYILTTSIDYDGEVNDIFYKNRIRDMKHCVLIFIISLIIYILCPCIGE